MYAGKVEICGVNTAQLPVLTERQKTELLLAARSGNAAARQQMIQGTCVWYSAWYRNLPDEERIWMICSRWGASG